MPAHAGIQYAAAYRFKHCVSGILGRPVKPGDDRDLGCHLARRNISSLAKVAPTGEKTGGDENTSGEHS
jgi:hypothetical protein